MRGAFSAKTNTSAWNSNACLRCGRSTDGWCVLRILVDGGSPILWSILVSAGIVYLFFFIHIFIAKIGLFVGTVTATIVLLGILALSVPDPKGRFELLSLSEVPLFGRLFELIFNPDTYYRTDTMLGFQRLSVTVLWCD